MSLWGNLDGVTGNSKPKYANTSPTSSKSTINGSAANTVQYYGNVWGVSKTEMAAAAANSHPQHAGWVSQKIGTGPVKSLNITAAGSGYSNGYLTFTNGGGTGANASVSVNATGAIVSVTLNNGGSGYTSAPTITLSGGANGSVTTTVGGRAGRISYETLVAMGSITGDNAADNTYFPGT